eukprot:3448264-Prymnesium_polylepis.1
MSASTLPRWLARAQSVSWRSRLGSPRAAVHQPAQQTRPAVPSCLVRVRALTRFDLVVGNTRHVEAPDGARRTYR